jgi:folate-binding protein YgfZ
MFLEEMKTDFTKEYEIVRGNGVGFYEQKRGLIEVSGKEAVMFLNGLITNDVAKLEENAQMLAAFPNAQGRLLATVRVLKLNGKFLFNTEAETHEKILKNLQRFTFAGDFFVNDLSEDFRYFEISGSQFQLGSPEFIDFQTAFGRNIFVPKNTADVFLKQLKEKNAVEISDELYEVLRIENGIPKYGADMDETTIVPELGIDGLISYNKGCYIGQEIIARIHFRGHVAKKLTGLVLSEPSFQANGSNSELQNGELKSPENKNAGKITSTVFSPKLDKQIALAYVRYDYLAEGTELKVNEMAVKVTNLPFVE